MPGVLHALGFPVAVELPDREVGEHADGRVHERHVQIAPPAAPLGVPEPDHEAEHRGVAAREVDHRDAALARRPVGLAGDRHVPGVALDQVVVGGLGGARAGHAEARERAADDRRVDRAERLVGEPELRRKIAPQVVVDPVRDADEIVEHRPGLRMAQVERQRLLAAVEGLEVERVAVGLPGRHVARDVAADRGVLDLDDLGAEVGEHLRAEGARAELGDGDDAEAVEGRACHTGSRPSPSVGWFFFGTSAFRRKVMTTSPRWLVTRVSTATTPRSPCEDSFLSRISVSA